MSQEPKEKKVYFAPFADGPFPLPCSIDILRDRAKLLGEVRSFFAKHKILEVDLMALNEYATVDLDIEPILAAYSHDLYLYTPDHIGHFQPYAAYGMKQLLAHGSGDIYQISHVFREGERDRLHNPEFTLIEWYRLGYNLDQMVEEIIELVRLFVDAPVKHMTYLEALKSYSSLDSLNPSQEEINKAVFASDTGAGFKDMTRDRFFSAIVEPQLEGLVVLTDFPRDRAVLEEVVEKNGIELTQRFEIFFHGIQIASGHLPLRDPVEHEQRLRGVTRTRAGNKVLYAYHPGLYDAVKRGLPPCAGAAVGFDRLIMARHQVDEIQAVLPIDPFGTPEDFRFPPPGAPK